MLNLSNKNRKNMRKKQQTNKKKNTETKSEYQEDFNDIILNDLVPEENRNEFGLDDVESSAKKSSGLNLGLKKKTSKKSKSSKTNKEEKSSGNDKSINKDKTASKEKSSGKDSSTSKKSKVSPEKKTGSKKQSKPKSVTKEDNNSTDLEEIKDTKPVKKATPKDKHHNGHSKKKRVKNSKEDEIEIKDDDFRDFEDLNLNFEDDFDDEGPMNFRSGNIDNTMQQDTLDSDVEKKKGNIVWSEDKFPKSNINVTKKK